MVGKEIVRLWIHNGQESSPGSCVSGDGTGSDGVAFTVSCFDSVEL